MSIGSAYNSVIALEWGMTSFEDEETERPEFVGEEIISPIDGSRIRYFSPQSRFRRIMGSLLFIFVLIVVVIGVVAMIFIFRWARNQRPVARFLHCERREPWWSCCIHAKRDPDYGAQQYLQRHRREAQQV
ncbi:hypothetical protein PINS_up021856 [Pythium insidiosum]|nr:hypothetical protein PINS_up021856 [Pythium insidiosum]